jgi:hypothetical protein
MVNPEHLKILRRGVFLNRFPLRFFTPSIIFSRCHRGGMTRQFLNRNDINPGIQSINQKYYQRKHEYNKSNIGRENPLLVVNHTLCHREV